MRLRRAVAHRWNGRLDKLMQVEHDSLVGTSHCEAAYPQRSHASATRSGRVNHRSLRGSDLQEGLQVVDVAFHRKRYSRLANSHRLRPCLLGRCGTSAHRATRCRRLQCPRKGSAGWR